MLPGFQLCLPMFISFIVRGIDGTQLF